MGEYEIIDIDAGNIGACSFCGYKDANNLGHRRKTDWLKERYAEGLRYKVLRSRRFGDIGMIEYALGNQAWRPVEAEGYLVIHCLFSILYEGKLIADRPVSGTRFWFIMRKIAKPASGADG